MGANPFVDTGTLTWYIILGCLVLGVTNVLFVLRVRRKIRALSSNKSMQVRQSIFDCAFFLNALFLMGFWLGYLLAASAIASPPFLPISHGIFAGALILLYLILIAVTRVQFPSRKGIYGFLFATILALFVAVGLAYFLLAILPEETLAYVFGSSFPLNPFILLQAYVQFLFAFPSDYFILLFILDTASFFVAIMINQLLRFFIKLGVRIHYRLANRLVNKNHLQVKNEGLSHV